MLSFVISTQYLLSGNSYYPFYNELCVVIIPFKLINGTINNGMVYFNYLSIIIYLIISFIIYDQ